MPGKLIEHGWISYLEQVVPKDASVGQVQATRQAFYSGACILFGAMLANLSEEQSEAGDVADAALMSAIQTELEEYGMKIVKKG